MRKRWIWCLVILLLSAGGWLLFAPEEPAAPLAAPTAADLGLLLLEEEGRLVVLGVSEHSAAADAGVEPGDRIVTAAEAPVATVDELEALLAGDGAEVLLLVEQNGRERVVELTVR